jgi:hypothetical protein
MMRHASVLFCITMAMGCVGEAVEDDDTDAIEQGLEGSGSGPGSGSGTCRYKRWSVPWSCSYWCVATEIGGGAWPETKSGMLSGTASCAGGSCATAAAAAEAAFSCPSSYPKLDGAGIWYATCRLSSGPNFGGVSCQIVY